MALDQRNIRQTERLRGWGFGDRGNAHSRGCETLNDAEMLKRWPRVLAPTLGSVEPFTHDMRSVCSRYGAEFSATAADDIVGVADNAGQGQWPLNGLRHTGDGSSGWFIWAGETLSPEPDFFKPTHAAHLRERCPEILSFLGLGPGWRFLVAPGQEDVWFDPNLLADEP